jgi:hypothetical protein
VRTDPPVYIRERGRGGRGDIWLCETDLRVRTQNLQFFFFKRMGSKRLAYSTVTSCVRTSTVGSVGIVFIMNQFINKARSIVVSY